MYHYIHYSLIKFKHFSHNGHELCVRKCATENENEYVSRAFDVRGCVNYTKKTTNEYYELLFIEGLTERTRIHTQDPFHVETWWNMDDETAKYIAAALIRRVQAQQCWLQSHALHSPQNFWYSCWIQFAAEITHIFVIFHSISNYLIKFLIAVWARVCAWLWPVTRFAVHVGEYSPERMQLGAVCCLHSTKHKNQSCNCAKILFAVTVYTPKRLLLFEMVCEVQQTGRKRQRETQTSLFRNNSSHRAVLCPCLWHLQSCHKSELHVFHGVFE